MRIKRSIVPELRTLLGEYPVVTILGPRQAGKTTLALEFLDDYGYANLEDPFFRDSNGNEVDLLIPEGRHLKAVEIKSAATFKMDQLKGLNRFRGLIESKRTGTRQRLSLESARLVYNGTPRKLSDGTSAVYFRSPDIWS